MNDTRVFLFEGYETPPAAIEAAARALCAASERAADGHDPAWTWLDFTEPARVAVEAAEDHIAAAGRELAAKWIEFARDNYGANPVIQTAFTSCAEIVRRGLDV